MTDLELRWLDVLRTVRNEIAKPGQWCKGTLRSGDARCAMGWLLAEAKTVNLHVADYLLTPCIPSPWLAHAAINDHWLVTLYNDSWDTTQADIVALYDRAIDRLQRLGSSVWETPQ